MPAKEFRSVSFFTRMAIGFSKNRLLAVTT